MYRKDHDVSGLQARHDHLPIRKDLLSEDKEVKRPSSDVYRGHTEVSQPFDFKLPPLPPPHFPLLLT